MSQGFLLSVDQQLTDKDFYYPEYLNKIRKHTLNVEELRIMQNKLKQCTFTYFLYMDFF